MNESNEVVLGTVIEAEAVTPPSVVEAITAAEINQQISTAHRFPRSMATFRRRATEMATLDEETAESCIYRRPVGKKKNKQTGRWEESYAEGMSIRMAEIVGASYGNLRVGAMLVEQSERFVRARGFAHDLESNYASTSEVVESTVDKDGNPYSERMRVVVAKAALSKARRDATFSVVPRALCKSIEVAARSVAIGDATTLAKRRASALQWIAKIGVDEGRVFAALGVAGEADIGLEQLETLTGLKTALKDGEITVDEAFPPLSSDQDIKLPQRKPAATATTTAPTTAAGAQPESESAPPPSGADGQAVDGAPPAAAPPHNKAPAAGTSKLATDGEKRWITNRLGEGPEAQAKLQEALEACGLSSFGGLTHDGFIALRDHLRSQS